ncbi:hypothetical protein FA95DRAFT_1598281, partial [Auriscalpium vulgare]
MQHKSRDQHATPPQYPSTPTTTSPQMQASKSIKTHFSRLKQRTWRGVPIANQTDPSQSSYKDPSQTKVTIEISLALLREVGEVSTQVPYIKGAAGVLLRLIMITDVCQLLLMSPKPLSSMPVLQTLSVYHAQWNDVEHNMLQLVAVLCQAAKYAEDHSWTIPSDLEHTMKLWSRELKNIEDVLGQYATQMKSWKIFPLLLNHGSTIKKINYCNERIKQLSDSYQASILITIQVDASLAYQTFLTAHSAKATIPAYCSTFCGRESHMTAILELFNNPTQLPVRTVILGPGGIGKTTLALAVLHHPIVVHNYHEKIYFVSCEGCLSISMLLNEIAKVLSIRNDSEKPLMEQNILTYLESSSSLLCLDNFETIWDTDSQTRNKVFVLLEKIVSLLCVSLVITMRGSERPEGINWSEPLLPPLEPLSFETSQNIFQHMSSKWDKWAHRLVEAVEGLPLALTIIAHLAQSIECEVLWHQWKIVNIGIIERDKGHRLTSLETSIQLSIEGFHFKCHPAALFLLSLLGMLPGGLSLARLHHLQTSFSDIENMEESVKALLESGLAYQVLDILQVHPLIHYYSQEHLPLSDKNMKSLEQYYINLTLQDKDKNIVSTEQLLECKNTGHILLNCLTTQVPDETLVEAISIYSWLTCVETGSFVPKLFEILKQKEGCLSPHCIMRYQLKWGNCLEHSGKYSQARALYLQVLKFAEMQKDEIYQANILRYLGRLESGCCEYNLACSYLQLSLGIYEKHQNMGEQAYVLSQLSIASRLQCLIEDAKQTAIRSIEIYEEIQLEDVCVGDSW